jgi:hypothetical protein
VGDAHDDELEAGERGEEMWSDGSVIGNVIIVGDSDLSKTSFSSPIDQDSRQEEDNGGKSTDVLMRSLYRQTDLSLVPKICE